MICSKCDKTIEGSVLLHECVNRHRQRAERLFLQLFAGCQECWAQTGAYADDVELLAAALAEVEAETIERCAMELEHRSESYHDNGFEQQALEAYICAMDVRALKVKK